MVVDKENAGVNATISNLTLATPIKAISERGSVEKSEIVHRAAEIIDDEVVEEEAEEVRLPLDDFRINGICATKEVNITAMAVVTPPDRSTTKGSAPSFSPDADVCKLKMGMKNGGKKLSDRALKPIPHVLNYAQTPRNDTLTSTWDKRKHKNGKRNPLGTNIDTSAVKIERENPQEVAPGPSLQQVQAEVRAVSAANKDLETALLEAKQKCSRIDEISRINESISSMAQALRVERDEKADEVQALEARLGESTAAVAALQTQLGSLEVLNSNLCSEMAVNQAALEEKSVRLGELEERLAGMSTGAAIGAEDAVSGISGSSSSSSSSGPASVSTARLQDELAEARARLELREAEVSALLAQTRDQQHGLAQAQAQAQPQPQAQLQQYEERLKALDEARAEAEAEAAGLQRQLAAKEEELMTLLHSSVQSSDLSSRKLAAADERSRVAEAELERVREHVSQLKKEKADDYNSAHQAELAALRGTLGAEISALNEDRTRLRTSCAEYRVSLERSREKLALLEAAMRKGDFSSASAVTSGAGEGAVFDSPSASLSASASPQSTMMTSAQSSDTPHTHSSASSSSSSLAFSTPPETEEGAADRGRIMSLQEDLRSARGLLIELSRSKDQKIRQMEALLEALGVDVDMDMDMGVIGDRGADGDMLVHDDAETADAGAGAGDIAEEEEGSEGQDEGRGMHNNNRIGNKNKSRSANGQSLVTRFLHSEERCKQLLTELALSQEQHEKAERTVRYLSDEFERSKLVLEKQLANSSSSNSELAAKMCDMNEKVEHLMAYGLKLTEQLSASKDNEGRLRDAVGSLERKIEALQQEKGGLEARLADATHQVDLLNTTDTIPPPPPAQAGERGHHDEVGGGGGGGYGEEEEGQTLTWDLQALRESLREKDSQLASVTARYNELSHQLEGAACTLEKAKQSKIRRYNKYVGLQNEYRGLVAQVQRLLEENNDLKVRHKTFVRTVEQTLVGGGAAGDRDKDRDREALTATFKGAGAGAGAGAEMNAVAWEATLGTPNSVLTDSTAASYLSGRGHTPAGAGAGAGAGVGAGAANADKRAAVVSLSGADDGSGIGAGAYSYRVPDTGGSTTSTVSVVTPSSAEMAIEAMNALTTRTAHKDKAGLASFPDLAFEGEAER